MLPVLALLAIVGLVAVVHSHQRQQRALHISGLVVALILLAAVTTLQAIPLPREWVETLSPRLVELQQFIHADEPFSKLSVSYEVGATICEATKLLIYATVAVIAHERVRAKRAYEVVAVPVVIAGISAATLALVHRALGLHRLMGVLPTRATRQELFTTFANGNHSAGFMALTCLTAIGLAIEDRARHRRVGYLAVAAVAGAVCVLTLSRGGIGALAVGVVTFGLLLYRFNRGNQQSLRFTSGPFIAAALLLPLAAVLFYGQQILEQFIGPDGRTVGFEEKLAAMKDAIPLIESHPFLGIGRGAYISVYPHYKTSVLQLTFAYPENIAIQLLSEWGLTIGILALLGLVYVVGARLVRALSVAQLGAMVGVAALCIQNVVDFSLELPGVAIPVIALLGAAGPRLRGNDEDEGNSAGRPQEGSHDEPSTLVRVPVRGRVLGGLLWGLPTIVLVVFAAFSVVSHDVYADLRNLEIRAHQPAADREPVDLIEAETVIDAHPANPHVTAYYAYLAETQETPDLASAIRWVNRTLYLAPTYADGHLQAGRLLVLADHRKQGFEAMRRAWELAPGDRHRAFIEQVVAYARSSREVRRAIPRRIPELDVLDEAEVDRLIQVLVTKDRFGNSHLDWARLIVEGVSTEVIADAAYWRWAVDAFEIAEYDIAKDAIERMREKDPQDPEAIRLHARILYALGDAVGAKTLLDDTIARLKTKTPIEVLRFRFQLAAEDIDEDLARRLLHEIRTRTPSTPNGQVEIARLEALIERRLGHYVKAIHALDTAITVMPSDASLRLYRAHLLRRIGRVVDARRDVEAYVERNPSDADAQQLLGQLREAETQAMGEVRKKAPSADEARELEAASDEVVGRHPQEAKNAPKPKRSPLDEDGEPQPE
ncbi:MAG: O-antigen ligase family protein [Myxococcota bacterium]